MTMPPNPRERRPADHRAPSQRNFSAPPSVSLPDDELTHFQLCVLRDAFLEAEARYWLKRATQFEAARPRPQDFNGRAAASQLRRRSSALDDVASACRAKAAVCRDRTGHA